MKDFLSSLFSNTATKKKAPTVQEVQQTIKEIQQQVAHNVDQIQENQGLLEEGLAEKAFQMEQQSGKLRNKTALLADEELPIHETPADLKKLSDAQIDDLALKYRKGQLDINYPGTINKNLVNKSNVDIDPYDELQNITNDDQIDKRAFKEAETRLRDKLGRKVYVTDNRKVIVDSIRKKNPALANEFEEMLGKRRFVFPKDIERLEYVANTKNIPWNVRDNPEILTELELLGSNKYVSPFRAIQKAAGGKYTVPRQIVDKTPEMLQKGINTVGEPIKNVYYKGQEVLQDYPRFQEELEAKSLLDPTNEEFSGYDPGELAELQERARGRIRANQEDLLQNMKARTQEKLPSNIPEEELLPSWLNNPKDFETKPTILPERESLFKRPVLDNLLKNNNVSAKYREHFGDALLDLSKEKGTENLNQLLNYVKENPYYFKNRVRKMFPKSELNNIRANDLQQMAGRLHQESLNIPEQDRAFWKKLDVNNPEHANEHFFDALDENPEFIQSFNDRPIHQADADALSAVSSDKDSFHSFAESERSNNIDYSRPHSVEDLSDAESFNAARNNNIARRQPQVQALEPRNVPRNVVNEKMLVREPAPGMPKVPSGSGWTKALKTVGKAADVVAIADVAKNTAALNRNLIEKIKEKGLVQGGWEGAKGWFSGAVNYGLNMGEGVHDLLHLKFLGDKYSIPDTPIDKFTHSLKDKIHDALPDNPLEKQRFQSSGTTDDVQNYFKEWYNDSLVGQVGDKQFQETGPDGYGNDQNGLMPYAAPVPIPGTLVPTSGMLPNQQVNNINTNNPTVSRTQGNANLGTLGDMPTPQAGNMNNDVIKQSKLFNILGGNTSNKNPSVNSFSF